MIKIKTKETEHGQKYITIYEIRTVDHKGKRRTIERFLEEEEAKEYVNFIKKNYKNLFISTWTRKQIVYC